MLLKSWNWQKPPKKRCRWRRKRVPGSSQQRGRERCGGGGRKTEGCGESRFQERGIVCSVAGCQGQGWPFGGQHRGHRELGDSSFKVGTEASLRLGRE